MNDFPPNKFSITQIEKVIHVGNEQREAFTHYTSDLYTHELIYNYSGNIDVTFNGVAVNVKKDSLRFLPKGKNFGYYVTRHEPDDCIDIFFDTDIPLSNTALIFNLAENNNIASLFKKLFFVWTSKGEGYYLESVSLLCKILSELQKTNYIPSKQYQKIKPAIDYIEEHFLDKNISNTTLSALTGISYTHLKNLFLKKYGLTPNKYIIQLKLNHACDLLITGRYTVSQVAFLCGYEDIYYFSKQFKNQFGVPPSKFISKYTTSK